MRKLERRALICVIICGFFCAGLLYFLTQYITDGKSWYVQKYNRHLYTSEGKLLSGSITDRNGIVLSYVKDGTRLYHEDGLLRTATLHVVGDSNGKIGSSVLSTCAEYFVTYSATTGAASVTQAGNTVTLTIDANACKTAYEAMDGLIGTVAVYNYKTGEILCLVSTPSYDPVNVPEDLETNNAYSGVYLNRFLQSRFTPGSTMKAVTLQAAFEMLPDVANRTFTCNGSEEIGGNTVRCTKAHGTLTLSEAFAQSCNCVFAEIAVELGGATLQKYVKSAGLMTSYSVTGLTKTAKGSFELVTISDYQLGYAGIGLFHDLVNPCELMLYYGAIANGGQAAMPTVLSSVKTTEGKELLKQQISFTDLLINKQTAATLSEYMIYNTSAVYDPERFPSVTIGAK